MIFRNIEKDENGWIVIDYTTTWRYGFTFMLDAMQAIIDTDFKDNLQHVSIAKVAGTEPINITDEVKNANNNLFNCKSLLEECGVFSIAGISQIMNCPFKIVLYNQTNAVRLFSPASEYFKENDDHVFDNYMNSIEIRAYCKDTERNTIKKLKNS